MRGTLVEDQGVHRASLSSDAEPPDRGTITFETVSRDRLIGSWELASGHRGVLTLGRPATEVPADVDQQQPDAHTPPPIALEVTQRGGQLHSMTVFRDDLKDIIATMKSLLPSPFDVVVRLEIDGDEKRVLAAALWDMTATPRTTRYIHLVLSEPGNLPRSISLDLEPGNSSFSVVGPDEGWVGAAHHRLSRLLQRKRSRWRALFEKWGLNVNGFALLLALTLAPSLELASRVVLMVGTVAGIFAFRAAHGWVTKLRIYLRDDFKASSWVDGPRLVTTLLGAALIAAVGWGYGWLAGGGLKAMLSFLGIAST